MDHANHTSLQENHTNESHHVDTKQPQQTNALPPPRHQSQQVPITKQEKRTPITMASDGVASIAYTLLLAMLPAAVEAQTPPEASRKDLDVSGKNIYLKEAIKINYGFQGQLQGAGTPNEAGIGTFVPLRVGTESVTFLDVIANVNFADYPNYSSIINTTVAGGTVSTSTRLGQRWLNGDRKWMYGFNFGYDSRPMATGPADTGVNVSDSQTVFFQQMAFNAEAVSNKLSANGYWLVPIGQYGWGSNSVPALNNIFAGDSLMTVGLDIGYNFTKALRVSAGYYYQDSDLDSADASGIQLKIDYNIANGLTIGGKLTYDPIYDTTASAHIKYRIGAHGYGAPSIKKRKTAMAPVIQALTTTPANRDVRVHDVEISDTSIDKLSGSRRRLLWLIFLPPRPIPIFDTK